MCALVAPQAMDFRAEWLGAPTAVGNRQYLTCLARAHSGFNNQWGWTFCTARDLFVAGSDTSIVHSCVFYAFSWEVSAFGENLSLHPLHPRFSMVFRPDSQISLSCRWLQTSRHGAAPLPHPSVRSGMTQLGGAVIRGVMGYNGQTMAVSMG